MHVRSAQTETAARRHMRLAKLAVPLGRGRAAESPAQVEYAAAAAMLDGDGLTQLPTVAAALLSMSGNGSCFSRRRKEHLTAHETLRWQQHGMSYSMLQLLMMMMHASSVCASECRPALATPMPSGIQHALQMPSTCLVEVMNLCQSQLAIQWSLYELGTGRAFCSHALRWGRRKMGGDDLYRSVP